MLRHDEWLNDEIKKLCRLPEQRLETPIQQGKWSIKQTVGHMFYWDHYILNEIIPNIAHGATIQAFPNHDLFNEKATEKSNRYAAKEMLQTFLKQRRQLLAAYEKYPKTIEFTIEQERGTLTANALRTLFEEHDVHHIKEMNSFIDNTKGD
ncbi:DinB family protein [Geomicrobium sediminis]|uniref:Damage-inducible protein DinB n=1 Tax=Geomicrobium sediminis TaxID=1347788 RepID=A0ABS2P982_9BACL|nr:DinB family protein [Geomicrobium sediminis]MBM7631916.1 putative damage-inducible protein DinB [Geomicrobium sediminis]